MIWQTLTGIPFVTNAPFSLPLKTSENLMVFWCFQGVKKGCIGNKWANTRLSEALVTFLLKIKYVYDSQQKKTFHWNDRHDDHLSKISQKYTKNFPNYEIKDVKLWITHLCGNLHKAETILFQVKQLLIVVTRT